MEPARGAKDHLQPAAQLNHVQVAVWGQYRHAETGQERED